MGLFGGSSSSSSTQNADLRIAAGASSTNQSQFLQANGKASTINVLDAGAVNASLELALKGIEGAQATAAQAITSTGGLLEGALRQVGEQQAGFTSAVENIKTADVRTLIVVGMAVVAIAAVFGFKGR